jgi:hypothetical protein
MPELMGWILGLSPSTTFQLAEYAISIKIRVDALESKSLTFLDNMSVPHCATERLFVE